MNSKSILSNIILVFFIFLCSCERLDLKKELLIKTSTEVTYSMTEAWISGKIYDFGEGVAEYGHCWSVEPHPTIKNYRTILTDADTTTFISTLSGLRPHVLYYVRAYARDKDSVTVYSEKETEFLIENIWVELPVFPGESRMGAFGFSVKNIGYFGGGVRRQGGTQVNINDFWSYNPMNSGDDGWTKLSDYPGYSTYNTTFVINDIGYVFNGQTKSLYRYDPDNDSWETRTSLQDDNPRIAPFIFVQDGIAYLLGGSNSNKSYLYNPGLNTWVAWDDAFQSGGRQCAYGFQIYDRIFVGGGFDNSEDAYEPIIYREFYEYDFYNVIWIPKADIVVMSFYPRTVALKNLGYILDYDIMLVFDPVDGEKGTWGQVEGFDSPRLFPVLINIGDIAYLMGGATKGYEDLSAWLRTPATISDFLNWETLNDFWAYIPYAETE
jgi:hypothetical protein